MRMRRRMTISRMRRRRARARGISLPLREELSATEKIKSKRKKGAKRTAATTGGGVANMKVETKKTKMGRVRRMTVEDRLAAAN